jgi:hypothetical protein
MTLPIVTEIPLRLEPTSHDPFIDDVGGRPPVETPRTQPRPATGATVGGC